MYSTDSEIRLKRQLIPNSLIKLSYKLQHKKCNTPPCSGSYVLNAKKGPYFMQFLKTGVGRTRGKFSNSKQTFFKVNHVD